MSVKKIFLILIAAVVLIWILIPTSRPEFGKVFMGEVPSISVLGKAKVERVNLYCDFSGSMQGYINFSDLVDNTGAKNNLVGNVATLLNKIEAKYKVNSVNNCGNRTFTKHQFIDALVNKSNFGGKTSMLWDLIDQGINSADDSSVSIVVSDMVLSYGQAKLKAEKDPDFNLHQIDGLTGKIKNVMSDAKKKKLDVVLIQYTSDFNGKYYYNYTENIKGSGAYVGKKMEKRPYYIMLIGTKANLTDIITNDCYADDGENINMYATFTEAQPKLKAVPYDVSTKATCWYLNPKEPKDASELPGGFYSGYKDQMESTFSITCENFILPRYYYKNKFSFEGRDEKYGKVKDIAYDDLTHKLTFTFVATPIDKLPKERGGADFEMDVLAMNNWIEDSKVANDNDVDQKLESLQGRTWGIQALFNGINDVYYGKQTVDKSKVASLKFKFYRVK